MTRPIASSERTLRDAMLDGESYDPPSAISTGHLGYSWTIEGGIVEVYTTGAMICRAPLSAPLMSNGSRSGRAWWPDSEPYRAQWYPLTFATIAEAESDRVSAYAPRTLDDLAACPFDGTSPDECAAIRERSVAGVSNDIPACPVHGAYPVSAR